MRGIRIFSAFCFSASVRRGGFFLLFSENKFSIYKYVLYICGNKSKKDMQTVNFFMPVKLETGHPTFEEQARWLGRATITQKTDYDDQDQPFSVDVADITDLFYLPYAGADIKTARRVELPDNSTAGQTLRFKLQQAAITAYHNPTLQQGEMPDEV